jgi:integrase
VALVRNRRTSKEESVEKRPFTLAEIKDLLSKAKDFWRYMITVGYYTGQSMGDLITLRASEVDPAQSVMFVQRRKSATRVRIPLRGPVREILAKHWPKDGGYFWPEQAKRYLETRASSFSQEFYAMLVSVGLAPKRDEKKKGSGKGRAAKRTHGGLGFHNLRHTFVTQLKIAGAVDSVAMELAGHRSSAISKVYTHLPIDTLSAAVNKLPEVES